MAKKSAAQLTAPSAASKPAYPGQRFGLPEHGPGSVASMPRRILALFIDWLLCMLIAYWLTGSQFWTIAVFAVEVYVLTATTGFTVGKRLTGIRTIRTDGGGPIGFRWALVRTAILLTAVPPLLTDRDLRGLHDRASDTIVVRLLSQPEVTGPWAGASGAAWRSSGSVPWGSAWWAAGP